MQQTLTRKLITWKCVTIPAPANWGDVCWRSKPPRSGQKLSVEIASAMAALRNQERIDCGGPVDAWTFRCPDGNGFSFFTIKLKAPWQASSPFAFPPDVQEVTGGGHFECRNAIKELNRELRPNHRAIVVLSLFEANRALLRGKCVIKPHHPAGWVI